MASGTSGPPTADGDGENASPRDCDRLEAPADHPRCGGDRPPLRPDGLDRHVPATAPDRTDPEVQAVIDRYETLLEQRRAADERRLERTRRGPVARFRRWLGGLF